MVMQEWRPRLVGGRVQWYLYPPTDTGPISANRLRMMTNTSDVYWTNLPEPVVEKVRSHWMERGWKFTKAGNGYGLCYVVKHSRSPYNLPESLPKRTSPVPLRTSHSLAPRARSKFRARPSWGVGPKAGWKSPSSKKGRS